jgi:hypothetical protein
VQETWAEGQPRRQRPNVLAAKDRTDAAMIGLKRGIIQFYVGQRHA